MSSEKPLMQRTVDEFVNELASSSPAPGGGSVAALCGALGAALVAMVCRLTVDKPKYAQVSTELRNVLSRAEDLCRAFGRFVQKDTEAFTAVMNAFALPKETDEQKTARSVAIQEATRGAAEVPLEVHALTAGLLELALTVARKGNVNSASDAGVAAEVARAAARSAALNVQINLSSLKDQAFVAGIKKRLSSTDENIEKLYQSVNAVVEEKLT
jgi:formiminotetrahydrofolate cyclodeaminase